MHAQKRKEAFHEPCRRNADFRVGASRRLKNRRYKAERVHGTDARPILEVEALYEPFMRKRQRAAALQDASEGHVLPAFRQVLDCASPLALWLSPQKWVHGTYARPMLEVDLSQEPENCSNRNQ